MRTTIGGTAGAVRHTAGAGTAVGDRVWRRRVLGGLLVLVAGCQPEGGESAEGPAASGEPVAAAGTGGGSAPPDACSLLTAAEVAAVLGGQVASPSSSSNMYGGSSCTYEAASDRLVAPAVNVMTWPGFTMAELQQSLKQNAGVSSFEPVPGVGDEAAWDASTLYVQKGGTLFSVAVAGSATAPLDASRSLAQQAAQRIP